MIKQVKIDVSKINKNNILERKFKNKAGELITVRELECEIKDVKEEKVLHTTDKGKQLVKVGFISEKSFQDASGQWQNGTILGDVTEWRDSIKETSKTDDIEYPEDEINQEDIPF